MAFKKFASAQIIEAEKITLDNWRRNVISAAIKQDPQTVEASPSFDVDDDGFVYVRVRAVSAGEHYGCNGNGDFFPESELQENYKTFIRRGNYLNHQSDDVSKAVGIILDAKYWSDPGTNYVECLLAVDKSEPISDKIAKGIADSVSMGAIVDRCECSICGKSATCESEYCDHLKTSMGRDYNGRKVYAINRGVNFYELSWVSVPADKDAKLLERVASKTENIPSKFDRMVKMADAFQALKVEAKEHKLIIKSLNDGMAECSAGDWTFSSPGKTSKDRIHQEFKRHTDAHDKKESSQDISKVKSQPGKGYDDSTDQVVEAAPEGKPKPPTPPKKEDKDLSQIVDSVVQKEVDRGMESELVSRVKDALKKLQLKQKVQREVSDEEILQSVREELALKTKEPVMPVQSSLHKIVSSNLDKLDREKDGETFTLTGEYSVSVYGKVAGNGVAQLIKGGTPTGLYAKAHSGEDSPISYYMEKFGIEKEKNECTEPDNSNHSEGSSVKGNLVIKYIPHESDLSKCAFVARKGNLEVRQSAAKLLSEAVQKAIVAAETKKASGKVEHGVGEYDSTKGKVDQKIEEGKEKAQPSDNTKNLGKVDDASEYSNENKPEKIQEGKEPIQPSQVVQKFAAQIGGKVTKVATDKASEIVTVEVDGGSISRLARLWGSRATLVKSASAVAGDPGVWAREMPSQVQNDIKDGKSGWARETPPPVAGPSGNAGSDVPKYFAGLNKGTLSGPAENWARKVASLNKELTQVKAEKKMLEAALSKERNEKIAEKKSSLISDIMTRMAESGALSADMGEVLEWKEKGLEHDDAMAKASAMAQDRQKRELSAMDVASLEQMKKAISRFAVSNKGTNESEHPTSVDVPFVGTDASNFSSLEDKLRLGW